MVSGFNAAEIPMQARKTALAFPTTRIACTAPSVCRRSVAKNASVGWIAKRAAVIRAVRSVATRRAIRYTSSSETAESPTCRASTTRMEPVICLLQASRYGYPGAGSQPLALVVSPSPSAMRNAIVR